VLGIARAVARDYYYLGQHEWRHRSYVQELARALLLFVVVCELAHERASDNHFGTLKILAVKI
jgi:hypothetical protein